MKINLYTDGGSRGNPGPAAVGAVLFDEKGNTVKEFCKNIGNTTNNVAEYSAVIYGLQEALFLKAESISLYLDSELVVKQLKGEYKVKHPNIKCLYDIVVHLISGLKTIQIKHIPREENKVADSLVNKALDMQSLF